MTNPPSARVSFAFRYRIFTVIAITSLLLPGLILQGTAGATATVRTPPALPSHTAEPPVPFKGAYEDRGGRLAFSNVLNFLSSSVSGLASIAGVAGDAETSTYNAPPVEDRVGLDAEAITTESAEGSIEEAAEPEAMTGYSQPTGITDFDFDGDGKADVGRWRSSLTEYSIRNSNGGSITTVAMGSSSAKAAPADFDGDGKTDLAVFDGGSWTIKLSSNGSTLTPTWGQSGDIPVPADYDGDGTADLAVWRPSTGVWHVSGSTAGSYTVNWGQSGDIPVVGNYDGDSMADKVVFRPSTGVWWIRLSSGGSFTRTWGYASDTPVPTDYDGDGKTDVTVYRPSTGVWYVMESSTGFNSWSSYTWGSWGDQPVPGDYDGDGKADLAVWRPTTGVWHIKYSNTSTVVNYGLGAAGDTAVPSAFLKQVGGTLASYKLAQERLEPVNSTGGIDLYSQNFAWSTSLAGLPGRSGLNAGFGMSYNSLVWTKEGAQIYFDTNYDNISPGFRFGFPTIEPIYFVPGRGGSDPYFAFVMITPSGGRVEFKQIGVSEFFETSDSSYLRLQTQGAPDPNEPIEDVSITLRGTDGTVMTYEWAGGGYRVSEIKDRNGNYIAVDHDEYGALRTVTDTLGRVITVNYDTELYPTTITQTWKGTNGAGSNVTHTWASFNYTTVEIDTDFDGLTVTGPPNETVMKVLEKVTYSDGSHTKFYHNSYAQVWKIENYAADNHKLNHVRTDLQSPASNQTDVPRFTQTASWVENFNLDQYGVEQETVVTSTRTPNSPYSLPGSISGTATKIEVAMAGHPHNAVSKTFVGETGWMEGLPIATEDWADGSSGSERKRWTWTSWTQDNTGVNASLNPRVIESRVGDSANVKRTTVEYYLEPSSTVAQYGRVKEVLVYDTDLSTVLKKAVTEYVDSSAYLTRRMFSLPAKVEVYGRESTGLNLVSKMTYAYDEGTFGDSGLSQNISPVQHDGTNFGASFIAGRGNLTSTTRWNVEYPTNSGEAVTSSQKFNTAGGVVSQTDPMERTVKIGYADNFNSSPGVSTWAYPTSVTDPANNSSTVKYRYDIGANVWAQSPAPAGQSVGKTTEREFDSIGRLLRETVANNGAYTRYEYPTNGIQSKAFATLVDINSNGADATDEVMSESWSDGAGRTRMSRSEHPGSTGGWAATLVEYDILGRVTRQSVPTEVNNNWEPAGDDATRGFLWSHQRYDWMGRVIRKIATDGDPQLSDNDSDVFITYEGCGCAGGMVTTIEGERVPRTDTTGTARRKQKVYEDILGRTFKSETFEWDGTTVYSSVLNTYNGRDQVTLARQFAGDTSSTTYQDTTANFDGHGRTSTQKDPNDESGTQTSWTYNVDDSIATVTDPRGAVTTYSYGNPMMAEKRRLLLGISYAPPSTQPSYTAIPDTPDVEFEYDDLGRRTYMEDGSGTTTYAYDSLSRLTSETKTFTGVTGNFALAYTYQLSGKLKSITDPFGDVINYNHDKAARTTSVTGSAYAGITTYASGIEFRAFGGVKEMSYGSSDSSNITYEYDSSLRPVEYDATSSVLGGGYVRRATYEYFKDGSVKKVNNLLDPGLDQNYKFDHVGRLVSSISGQKLNNEEEMEEPYTQAITYNAFGDMTSRSSEIWGIEKSFSASYTNGRKTGGNEIYDKSGNLVDKTTTSNNYERWKFDAAGRNHETVMRWYQAVPAPSIDQTQTIATTFDGDGRQVKRVDTNDWFHTFPDTNSGTSTSTEFYVRSSVLGGQVITKLDGNAGKRVTLVYAGSSVMAEQRVIASTPGVFWRHEDVVTGSYSKIGASGNYGGNAEDSPLAIEYEPLGGKIAVSDPYWDDILIPAGMLQFKSAGDITRVEHGCMLPDIGVPAPCTIAAAYMNHIDGFVESPPQTPAQHVTPQGMIPGFIRADNRRDDEYWNIPGLMRRYGPLVNDRQGYRWEVDRRTRCAGGICGGGGGGGGAFAHEEEHARQGDNCGINPITGQPGISRDPTNATGNIRSDSRGGGLFNDSRGSRPHEALDLAGVLNQSPVLAPFSGVITFSGNAGGNMGQTVIIKHDNGMESQFAHMQAGSLIASMTDGRPNVVNAGDQIGIVGNTGNANLSGMQAHVHWILKDKPGGNRLDPEAVLNSPCPE